MEALEYLFLPEQPTREYLQQRLPDCFVAPNAASGIWVYTSQPRTTNLDYSRDKDGQFVTSHVTGSSRLSRANGAQAAPAWRLLTSPPELQFTAENSTSNKFFLFKQKHSRSRIGVSQELFEEFANFHGLHNDVMCAVACFGVPGGEDELGPPPAAIRWVAHSDDRESHLECVFTLIFAQKHLRQGENAPWSIRKTLIYHRYDGKHHSGLLFMVSASDMMSDSAAHYLSKRNINSLASAADLDCLLVSVAASTWRPYLIWLAEAVKKKADRAIVADFEGDGVRLSRLEEQQSLKILEDSILDAKGALDSIAGTAAELLRKLSVKPDNHGTRATLVLRDLALELEYLQKQAATLLKKAQGSRVLVAEILQLENGNALQLLAIESKNENKIMQELTERATRDAAAVKALTVITLIYLPTTAVLNFFSNGLVNFSERSRLEIATNWWIFVVVAVPLTIITLYSWKVYVAITVYGRIPKWLSWVSLRRPGLTD